MSYYTIKNTDELYHHGIKGQRWGFRRYQNEDGTYTDAGKQRYLTDKTSKIKDEAKRAKVEKKLSRKWDINKAEQEIDNRTSFIQKGIFNDATRARAAKLVVDKQLTHDKAIKQANKEAIRNTAIAIGVIGALSVAEFAYNFKKASMM